MPSLREEFATDVEDGENGRWFTLRPGKPPIRFRLRASTSRTFRRQEIKLQRQFRAQFAAGGGTLDPDSQDEYETLLCLNAVVVGWDGVTDDAGAVIPFTRVKVKELMEELPRLRREVLLWCRTDENFKPAEVKEAEVDGMVKNSERPSESSSG